MKKTNSRKALEAISSHVDSFSSYHPETIIVHCSQEEMDGLDEMQGEKVIDPVLKIRSYVKLGYLVETRPEVRKILESIAEKVKEDPSSKTKSRRLLDDISEDIGDELPKVPSYGGKESSSPLKRELSEEGRYGDDDICLFPVSLADFFDELRGEPKINPKTGLREYWKLFKSIIKIGAPILGAFLGSAVPGVGSILGGAIGGALGGAATSSGKERLQESLIGGGLGALGGWLGNWGSAGANVAKEAGKEGAAELVKQGASQAVGETAKEAGKEALKEGAKEGFWQTAKEVAKSPFLPLAISGGLLYKGHQEGQKDRRKAEEEARRKEEENRRGFEEYYTSARGADWNSPLVPFQGKHREINPSLNFNDPYFYQGYKPKQWFTTPSYAKGGHIKNSPPIRYIEDPIRPQFLDGHEKGQADNLYTDALDGTYIIDASSISDLGDGNSKAGWMQIQKLIKSTPSIPYYMKRGNRKFGGMIPVALSAGEVAIPPSIVRGLGNGDDDTGADRLRKMVANIRKHKRSNSKGLPPKAKDIFDYLPRIKGR